MSIINICNKIIEYSFYAIFLLVPLVFAGNTSELFELNKMWLTWAITIIIGASWFTKMVLQRKIGIQKTPLDIPILLFLASQLISTIFSWDRHTSFWGYYSRFNGGFLSTLTYVFLYYAFVSNFVGNIKIVWRIIYISLVSGAIVALWGLPSHFGYDPTCFIFRGTLDVSCWTADFLPKVRIFSTLGQPAWLAAYLAVLIPISIIMFIKFIKNLPLSIFYLLLSALFYIDLLYTQARGGILGLWISLIFFFLTYLWLGRKHLKSRILKSPLLIVIVIFLIITFIIGTPISKLNNFTLPGLKAQFAKIKVVETPEKQNQTPQSPQQQSVAGGPARNASASVAGGTESGNIRLLVWQGGLEAWRHYPIFGTGVETFAFAYYKYKPSSHNLTSEWNFLYNKAHNEYVNYLATTGLFGLGSYILMIGYFLFISLKKLKTQMSNVKTISQNPNLQKEKFLALNSNFELCALSFALLSGYMSILITNFFGFSVVIINIYLFLIPAFVLILNGMIKNKIINTNTASANYTNTVWQWTPIFFITIISLYLLITLFNYWRADISYALGYNLNRVGEYQEAYANLHKAVDLRGDEPVFKDELTVNNAILAMALISDPANKDDKEAQSTATKLAQEALTISDEIISKNPNNIVFWKSRVRLFFTLSQADAKYLTQALTAIEQATMLAPNDANILYNLGVLYGQNNKIAKGIDVLEKAVVLKPDYVDARYALGLFYHSLSMDESQKNVVDKTLNQKAIDQMKYILTNISPDYSLAKDAIRDWENQ